MKIEKIEIKNFRSIVEAEFRVNNFNIFVGQNNCGKTNFFEAIDYFFKGEGKQNINNLKYNREPNNELLVRVEFSGAQDGAIKMLNKANQTKILKVLGEEDTVVIERSSTDGKRKVYVAGEEVNPGTGFDGALNDFLPKFEYVSTKQYYDALAKYNKTSPIGIMLSAVLTAILEKDEQYLAFQKKFKELFEDEDSDIRAEFENVGGQVKLHLEKQFPDCTSVKFEVTPPVFEDLLKNFDTTINDGIETSAEEKGDGMQRALMLAIIQAYVDFKRNSGDPGKSFLFFIDEAELHLHPTAQRNLKNALHSLSIGTDQVFINTHSSVLVADDSVGQMILKVEKDMGKTLIQETTESQKPYIVYELLGGSPADLLMPRNFLIVEGKCEFELLTRVIARFYSSKPSIQVLAANGDIDQVERSINSIEQAFNPLNHSIYRNKVVITIDKPSTKKEPGVKQFKSNHPHLETNGQIFEAPKRDIEQCYPAFEDAKYRNWKKTQSEVDAMDGKKKMQLAKHIGDSITQEQFEKEMSTYYLSLEKSWDLSFNS
jgi:putative ATP-dependent endonuclease of the OLD family